MNSSQVRTAGLVAYIHAIVVVLVIILGFVFAASMISDAAKGKTVTPGGIGITSILGWIRRSKENSRVIKRICRDLIERGPRKRGPRCFGRIAKLSAARKSC